MTDMDVSTMDNTAEENIWAALDLDEIGSQMETTQAFSSGVVMGTGKSQGACYACDGSSTTAGCNGCN